MTALTTNQLFYQQVELLLIGVYLALGIYNFLIWLKVRKEQKYLFFMLYALALTIEAIGSRVLNFYDFPYYNNFLISIVPATFMILVGTTYKFNTYTALAKMLGNLLLSTVFLCSLTNIVFNLEFLIHLSYLFIFIYVIFFFLYTLLEIAKSPDKKYDILLSVIVSGIFCGVGALFFVLKANPPEIIFYISSLVTFLAFAHNLSREYHQNYTDATRLRDSLQEEVDRKTAELNRSNSELRSVLNTINHDFKDSLSVVSNCFNRYVKNPTPDYEEIINKELTRITQDMNAYLYIKKDKSSNQSVDSQTCCNLSDFLKERVELYKIELEEQGSALKITANIEPNIFISTCRTTLNKIISNLISNAIKYTLVKDSAQTAYITISLTKGRDNCLLSIKDNGIGIKAENQKEIFEPFFRESERVEGRRGRGLGLSIVKEAVESLDGSINLVSEEDKGSTFNVILKRHRGERLTTPESTDEDFPVEIESYSIDEFRQEPVEGRYNILYVENELNHIKVFCDEYGDSFNIQLAMNGKEALELLKTIPRPHLIISDIHMPSMDGFAFREAVLENYREIPFIFLTALDSEKVQTESYCVGALDIRQKTGLDYDRLKMQIMALCNHSNIGREQIEQAAEVYSREKIELIAKHLAFNETRTHIFGYMLEGYSTNKTKRLLLEQNRTSLTKGTVKRNRSNVLKIIRAAGYEYVTDVGSLRDFFNNFSKN